MRVFAAFEECGQTIMNVVRHGHLGQGFDGGFAGGLATVGKVDRDDREDLKLGLGVLARLLVDQFAARFQASSQASFGQVRSVAGSDESKSSDSIESPSEASRSTIRASGPEDSRSTGR